MSEAHPPKVSLIVNTYGRAEGLQRLFDSIETSTPREAYEIVVVSSDPPETAKAAWLRAQTHRAHIIFADSRKSWQLRKKSNYYYINLGIKNSSYQWIFPISDDMYVAPDWYQALSAVIANPANANAGLIIAASHIGSYKHAVGRGMRVDVIGKTKKGDGPWKNLYLSDVSLVRRDVMELIGLFDERMDWFGSGLDLSLAVEVLTDTDTIIADTIRINHPISAEHRGTSMGNAFVDFHYLRRKWNRICRKRNYQYVWDPGVPPYTIANRIKNYIGQRAKISRHYARQCVRVLRQALN